MQWLKVHDTVSIHQSLALPLLPPLVSVAVVQSSAQGFEAVLLNFIENNYERISQNHEYL